MFFFYRGPKSTKKLWRRKHPQIPATVWNGLKYRKTQLCSIQVFINKSYFMVLSYCKNYLIHYSIKWLVCEVNTFSNVIDSIIKLWKTRTYRVYITLAQRDRNRMGHSNVWRIATGVKCPTKCNGSLTPVHTRLLGSSYTIDGFELDSSSFKMASLCSRVQVRVSCPKLTSDLSYQNLQNKFTLKHDFYY